MIPVPFTTFGSGAAGTPGTLNESGQPNTRRYYGKYRGKVADNVDPLFLGRILPIVPAISEVPLTWAMPCVPYAGQQVGFYAIPPIDANVWIEFEGGDPNSPIWTGCFWEEGQVPLEVPPPGTAIFKTACTTLIVRDLPGAGGLSLEITPPAVEAPISINLDSAGIQVLTEALLSFTSQATTLSCDALTMEAEVATVSGAAMNIASDVTNITSETVSMEGQAVTITAAASTEVFSEAVTIAAGVTNILDEVAVNIGSPIVSIESPVTNITSAAVTIEGAVAVEGAILEDGLPVMVIPA